MNDEYIDKEEMNLQENSLVSGMYKDWFLDYASYVILERAIPLINDGTPEGLAFVTPVKISPYLAPSSPLGYENV